ncbi:putative KH domain protein [Trichinella spiralis]|uniref:K Homology domain-containing protein n=1 Tax=Trichinella spiralis TaxID=6334 RepID=E5SDL9_TRISP|nr:putative KH domain protein [Trichinella spiralis]KRY28761.1 hypothetical protein T01_14390 [Trichinella spiralis]
MDLLCGEIFEKIDSIIMEAKEGRVPENFQMKLLQILSFLKVHGKRLEIVSRERIESLYEAFNVFNSMLMDNTAENNSRHLLNELLELREKRWNIHKNDQDFDLNELEIFDIKNLMNKDIKCISKEKNGNLPQIVQNKDMEKIPKTFNECKAICKTSHSVAISYKENMPMKKELSIVEKKYTKFLSNDGQNMKIINWNNAVKFIESLYLRQHEPFLSLEEEKIFQNVMKIMNNNANKMDVSSQMIIDMLNTFIRDLLEKKTAIFNPNLKKEMKTFLKKQNCNKRNNMENALPMVNGSGQKELEPSTRTTSVSTKNRDLPVILLAEKTNYPTSEFEKFNLCNHDNILLHLNGSAEIFTKDIFVEEEPIVEEVFYREIFVERSFCSAIIGHSGSTILKIEHLTNCTIIMKPTVEELNHRNILIFGFTEDAVNAADSFIRFFIKFGVNLSNVKGFIFKPTKEDDLQTASLLFQYPVNLNEQLLGNVSSVKDLYKMRQVIEKALDYLYYRNKFLINGKSSESSENIFEKKKTIHFRLTLCPDHEDNTVEFNRCEHVIYKDNFMKESIINEIYENASNQHIFSILEAEYELRKTDKSEWMIKGISVEAFRKIADSSDSILYFIESAAGVKLSFNNENINLDKHEVVLLFMVSSTRKRLTSASKLIDFIGKHNLNFVWLDYEKTKPISNSMASDYLTKNRMVNILNEIRHLEIMDLNRLIKWDAFKCIKKRKTDEYKKNENLNVTLNGERKNAAVAECVTKNFSNQELCNTIDLWKIMQLKKKMLQIQTTCSTKNVMKLITETVLQEILH